MATPGGVFVRRAEFDDQLAIQALVGEDAAIISKRFGLTDAKDSKRFGVQVTHMIETASLGITAVDEKGTVVGYAAFYDYAPYPKQVDQAAWPKWLHDHFGHTEYTAANAAWLSFFVADHLVQNDVAESILRTAFTTLSEIDVILFAIADDVRPFAPIRDTFEPLQCLKPDVTNLRVHACHRGLYLPDLLIRKARVEDHDDLVPVFNAQSEVLTERYGEFFIAELIERQDERNTALVAEVDGHAIGLLALSADIDVALLQTTFELTPYASLERVDDEAEEALAQQREARRARARATAEGKQAAAKAKRAAAKEAAEAAGEADEEAAAEGEEGAETDAAAKAEAEAAMEAAEFEQFFQAALSAMGDDIPTSAPKKLNAFCVSVFCMDESFESRSADFLHVAFACFPDREYAVITLPHTTPEFSLVNSFTQVEPLPSSSFGHILYVFHRDALGGARSLSVRPATVLDKNAVKPLIETLADGVWMSTADITAAFEEATGPVEGGEVRTKVAFIAECLGQPVGMALVDDVCDVNTLQGQYALEDFILFSEHPAEAHSMLKTFVVNPMFMRNARWIFKEIFRQHKRSCLYLQLAPGAPIPGVLTEFVQSKPRRTVEQSEALRTELNEQREQLGLPPRENPPTTGSLYFLTRKLLSEPKIINNTRIVIVGASDAALSLLEALVSVPYLYFAYIYLVAPQAGERLQKPRGAMSDGGGAPYFARTGGYTQEELRALGMGARVRLVESSMVDIDRQAKAIVLPEGSILPYDHLVIAPDFGDQSLAPLGEQVYTVRGAFSLFDETNSEAAAAFIGNSFDRSRGKCIVYGSSIHAFATVRALLSVHGVSPSSIVMVVPPPTIHDEEIFADPKIRDKVLGTCEKLGINRVEGMTLAGVDADDDGMLKNVMLETEGGAVVSQPCTLLLCAGAPQVQRATFEAINGNSLVYDGRLVVDTSFCTNDKSIYAAGVITKFSRRYRTKTTMGLVSGRECGAKLASVLLPVLDPLSASSVDVEPSVPTFEKPRIVGAHLPGGLHYVSIAQPLAGCDTYAKIKKHATFGRELVSDKGPDTYCAVRLDKYGVIRAINYLGVEQIEEQNWANLIGLPESALNNLAPRFDEGIVRDLPTFLRENWATALYHDRFGEFLNALRTEIEVDDAFKAAMDKLRRSAEYDAGKLSPVDFMNLLPEGKRNLVRTRLLDFVAGNQNYLDMYLVPSSGIMKKMEEAKKADEAKLR